MPEKSFPQKAYCCSAYSAEAAARAENAAARAENVMPRAANAAKDAYLYLQKAKKMEADLKKRRTKIEE